MAIAKKKVTKKKTTTQKKAARAKLVADLDPKAGKGRPSEYDPSFCAIVIEEMAKGYSKEAVAGVLEIAKSTLYDWIKEYPDFSYAVSIGESKSQHVWEKKSVDHVVHTRDGKQINGQVYNLNMKNRFGWSDKKEVELGEKTQAVFKLAYNLDEEPDV